MRPEVLFDEQLDLDPEKLIVIDQTGSSTKMARLRGRPTRGERGRASRASRSDHDLHHWPQAHRHGDPEEMSASIRLWNIHAGPVDILWEQKIFAGDGQSKTYADAITFVHAS